MPDPKRQPDPSPGTRVQKAFDALPKRQRSALFYVGLVFMVGSVGLAGALILQGKATDPAVIPILAFLAGVFFVGFLLDVPKAAVWLLNHIPLPKILKRKLDGS